MKQLDSKELTEVSGGTSGGRDKPTLPTASAVMAFVSFRRTSGGRDKPQLPDLKD